MEYTRPSQISSQLPNGFRFSAGLACRSAAQTTDPSEIATMLLLGAGAPLSTPKSRASSLLLAYVHAPAPTPINPICGGGGSQRGASHRSGPDHSAGRRSLVAAPLTPTRGRGATSLSTPPFNAVSETGGRNRGLGSCGPPPPVRIAKAGRRQARYHAGPAASRGRPSRGLSRRDKCRPSSGRDTRRSAAGPRVATPRGRPQKGSRGLRRGPPPPFPRTHKLH